MEIKHQKLQLMPMSPTQLMIQQTLKPKNWNGLLLMKLSTLIITFVLITVRDLLTNTTMIKDVQAGSLFQGHHS